MPASSPFPSGHDRAATVTRLRAAGCVFAEDEARLLISAARTPAALAAMVDRLVHHAESIVLKGDSYRLKGKGKEAMASETT